MPFPVSPPGRPGSPGISRSRRESLGVAASSGCDRGREPVVVDALSEFERRDLAQGAAAVPVGLGSVSCGGDVAHRLRGVRRWPRSRVAGKVVVRLEQWRCDVPSHDRPAAERRFRDGRCFARHRRSCRVLRCHVRVLGASTRRPDKCDQRHHWRVITEGKIRRASPYDPESAITRLLFPGVSAYSGDDFAIWKRSLRREHCGQTPAF